MISASPLRELQLESGANGARSPTSRSRWPGIAERTIYFGHQSVGSGIVAAVEGLAQEHVLPLRVVQTREPASVTGHAFVHFLAGQNRDYASKNAAVLRLLESPTRAKNPIVLLKYCYVDINSAGDTARMFEAYRDTVDTIQFEHPDVTVVHATVPLTTVESAIKSGAQQLFGRPTRRQVAVARHRYNELVRAEFTGTEPVFDLATVQSAQRDGTVAGFMAGGAMIETLAPSNTYDGVHLTPQCERAAATVLLDVLSDVIEAAR